jgi:hypothetical protein
MPTCPRCRDEFEEHVTTCPDCDVALVPDDQPLPPRVDALLGRFDPRAATPVVRLLEHRGVAYDALHSSSDDEADEVEVVVDRDFRDDLRAELVVNWRALVASLEPEERDGVLARGGTQPGWLDAPTEAWVDRGGRLQVGRPEHEELEADARRTVGPSMAVLGAVLLLFGWFVGGSELAVLAGIGLLVVGLLLPA